MQRSTSQPLSSAFNAGNLTLSITGHTHLIQLAGGTQPYGDQFGSTKAYEIIIGNGGAPLDAGPSYGYAVATRRASDGAIVVQMFESADTSSTPSSKARRCGKQTAATRVI